MDVNVRELTSNRKAIFIITEFIGNKIKKQNNFVKIFLYKIADFLLILNLITLIMYKYAQNIN